MKSIDLKAFRKANKISQVELAEYLGVGQPFISQIEKGTRPFPEEYISTLSAHPTWDTSMLTQGSSESQILAWMDTLNASRKREITPEMLQRAIENTLNPKDKFLVGYLERKIKDLEAQIANQEALINRLQNEKGDLREEVGMLKKEVELARKGEIASIAGDSLSASAV